MEDHAACIEKGMCGVAAVCMEAARAELDH
jgi:hypothetical protein